MPISNYLSLSLVSHLILTVLHHHLHVLPHTQAGVAGEKLILIHHLCKKIALSNIILNYIKTGFFLNIFLELSLKAIALSDNTKLYQDSFLVSS